MSCAGSLEIVDPPVFGVQLEFDDGEPDQEHEPVGPMGTMALF
ncbi:hypothetical protein [Streptomyces tendae]|nr:hypothetical protein [Streptomyces tendae]